MTRRSERILCLHRLIVVPNIFCRPQGFETILKCELSFMIYSSLLNWPIHLKQNITQFRTWQEDWTVPFYHLVTNNR